MNLKKAFTLVELIITIAIIAILSVASFLYIKQWISKSRDSRRMADMNTITKALEIGFVEKGKYVKPSDNAVSITTSGSDNIIGYQGNLGEENKNELGINGEVKDPNTKEMYAYRVNAKQSNYAILGFVENGSSYESNRANAVEYSKLYPKVSGEAGVILDSSQTPVQNTGSVSGYIDIFNTTGTYRVYIGNNDYLEGTGISLQGIEQFGENGYGEPLSCPDGFIPMPGNRDFKQAGFCVAKYEMKQIDGTAGNLYRTSDGDLIRNSSPTEICGSGTLYGSEEPCYFSEVLSGDATDLLNGKIVSKPEGLPIVRLNQATAIQACKAMGQGYHLMTNKEYTTIARDLEQQGKNRTSGIIGEGGIYRGKNYMTYSDSSLDHDKTELNCRAGTTYTGVEDYRSCVQDGLSTDCELEGRNKRELFISNTQSIWDLAGNVWEFVNGRNTINGSGYNTINASVCDNEGGDIENNVYSFTKNAEDGNEQCIYKSSLFVPKISGLNISNGIGRIISGNKFNTSSDRIIGRGGGGTSIYNSGIYFYNTTRFVWTVVGSAGFRCAK